MLPYYSQKMFRRARVLVRLIYNIFYRHYPETQSAPCPFNNCGKNIPEYEIKQHLTKEQLEKLNKIVEESILN